MTLRDPEHRPKRGTVPVIAPPAEGPIISAVTGTNGKTSVATATRQLMQSIGWATAGYDSTGITDVAGVHSPDHTRRSADYLPELIEKQASVGAEAFSLEAFVGILADGLLERVKVDVAVSTGFERDHLDVHKTLERYWAAKLRLFEEHLRPDGVAVLASDSAQGDLVQKVVKARGCDLITVGQGGDIELTRQRVRGGAVFGRLVVFGTGFRVSLPTTHPIAITNLLLAAGAVMAAGGEPGAVAHALARTVPPPGRLELIAHRNGIRAMVDTAHNPGALRSALEATRIHARGRVLLVFGAGGESDPGKRREMGAVAESLADVVIVTDDNPRREPPHLIREDLRAGAPHSLEIAPRRAAILVALEMARPGDVILVAGKGDEDHQILASGPVPHDDREVLRAGMMVSGSSPISLIGHHPPPSAL